MGKIIADLFYQHAAETPEKTAIWCDGESLSYRQLADLVSRYSNLLLSRGVRRGEHIGVPMLNNINSVALIMAANNTGIGLVPINPSTPQHFVKTTFASGDVKHLIAHRAFLKHMAAAGGLDIPGITVCTDGEFEGAISLDEIQSQSAERSACPDVTGDETLVLVTTSGSTGSPKPIQLTQNCKHRRAQAHFRLYGLNRDDVILAATPLYHTLAVRLVMLPLQLGGTAVLLPRFTPDVWLKCIQDQKVTYTIAVSSQLAQVSEILADTNYDVSSLRCVVSSSAWLEPVVKERLISVLGCDFHEIYGTSETASPTDIDFRESVDKQRSVGRCVPGAKIRIRRTDGSEANTGEVGEITADTDQIFAGYYNRPDLTEAAFDGKYFRTGDLGYVDEDGYLYFAGRLKEIIVTGGINVYPQDIETTVLNHEKVRECAAFSYHDDKLGEVVAMAVSPKIGASLTKRELAVYCARNLADFQQPRVIFIVDEIPKNNMGKITRLTLEEYFSKNPQ